MAFNKGVQMKKSILGLTVLNFLFLIGNATSPAWASLIVDRFELAPRSAITSFPVPSFRPSTPGKVIAVDAFPSAGAVANPDSGFAWFDACDADLMHANGNVPVTCARMGVKADRVEFGSRHFDGGTPKDIYIIKGTSVIARFGSDGLTVNGPVKASSFITSP